MVLANDSTKAVNSDQEEFSYHCKEAEYHYEQARRAMKEVELHMIRHKNHVDEAKTFIA